MNLSAAIPVLVGAIFGFVANGLLTYWADRRKLRYRWDEPAFAVFSSFAASARDARDGAARLSELLPQAKTEEDTVKPRERFDELHAKMRSDFEQVALIGTPEVIEAGRQMIRGVYQLRELAVRKVTPHNETWRPVHTELMNHQKKYYIAVRTQLQIPAGPDPGSGVDP